MRWFAFFAGLAACLGCSFPEYVADLDAATIVDAATIDGGDGATADTCSSPCGCASAVDAGKDAGVDADVTADAFDASTSDADASSDAVVAVDGSIGESCGPCSTGKKLCVGTTLACSVADDRKTISDSSYPHTNVTRALSRRDELAIGYPMHQTATPYSVQLTIARTTYACAPSTTPTSPDPACDKCTFDATTGIYTCRVTKPVDGNLVVKLMRGQPTETSPIELAKVLVPSTSIALGSGLGAPPTTIVFPISAAAAPLASGTAIYVDLSTDSSAWSFVLAGDRPRTTPAPADVIMWSRSIYPATPWMVETTGLLIKAILPAYEIDVRGCF